MPWPGQPGRGTEKIGRWAAPLVQGATAWRQHLGELLDARQSMCVLAVGTRQALYDLAARHRLSGASDDDLAVV